MYLKSISCRAAFTILCICIMIVSEIVMYENSIFKYTDELITILCLIYSIGLTITKKINNIDLKIIICLAITMIIGIISNIISGIREDIYVIILDIVSNYKIFIIFIGFKYILTENSSKQVISFFRISAKIFIVLASVCAIVSVFFDIGMRGEARYGLNSFQFIFRYPHVLSVITLVSILIITASNPKNNKVIKYIILAVIIQTLTLKGPAIIWGVAIIIFYHYFKKNVKIKIKVIIPILIVCMIIGGYQIQNYLLNEDAPRFIFIKYGIITANEFAPLGSGFSTYGSDMAGKYYSSLYMKYGFNSLNGMSMDDQRFLNDNYWPMILGQFGWIGSVIFIYIYLLIIKQIQNFCKANIIIKVIVMSSLFYILLHSFGSAILTSSVGGLLFVIFAVILRGGNEKC